MVIPGNDDAIRSSALLAGIMGNAAKEGRELFLAGRKEDASAEEAVAAKE